MDAEESSKKGQSAKGGTRSRAAGDKRDHAHPSAARKLGLRQRSGPWPMLNLEGLLTLLAT
jgi:hypothetical protein